ncbi:MAG: Hsp90 cochaperone [Thelocarpon superellum]|nr:MAG: Hsp90 cochaperone [Thelocarpon superellum]
MADALKAQGNKAFAEKKFDEAIDKFTQAIELEPTNHVLYSNRSGAYASKKEFASAREDAEKVIEIKPDWAKGWGRKGAALHGEGDLRMPFADLPPGTPLTGVLVGSLDAYEEALRIDPSNAQAKSGRDAIKRAMDAEARADGMGSDPSGGLGSFFNDPELIPKLAKNPKTSRLLADPDFMAKLQHLRQNPNDIGSHLSDPRFLQVMGVMMGIDMQFGQPGDAPSNPSTSKEPEDDTPMPDVRPTSSKPANPAKAPEPEPEPEPEDEEALANKKAKEEAEAEKKLGTESYKKRQFDAAIEHYNKAWELHKDITYLTNLGAAKFEKGDYEGAIEACKLAVEEGREVLADFKLIAKAFGRIGTAYEKLGDLANAIVNYQKSLTEHRTPDVLAKLRAAEKAKIEHEKQSYIDPTKAEEAREEGNKKFKEADWPGAVEAYSEMIKRAPDDPRGYSNRAAAFIKLLTFPSAVDDCNAALKKDPKFIRAYLRKAQAYFGMREYSKCLDVCSEAMENDEGGANAREIEQQQQKALQAMYSAREGETEEETMARIQKDPEILGILQDPVMQSILQQAKGDPSALQDHMKNPTVRSKLQRLIHSGVIRIGR